MSEPLDWGTFLDYVDRTLDLPDGATLAGMKPEEIAELPSVKFRETVRSRYLARKADALIRAHEYGEQKLVLSSEADIRNRPSPEWLVADLIQENTIALLAGPGGLGKSFLALGLARAIACGAPFFGKQTKRGRVLYVVAEGAAAFGDRIDAWNEAHPSLQVPRNAVTYVEAGVNLQVEESLEQVRELIRDGEYSLVILDTLNQLAYFENENNNAEAGTVFRNIQSLRMAREGTSILVLDHTPAGGGKARGATAKRDNSDTVIMAIRSKLRTRPRASR
ncbi:AAA family ATPase [Microbacterium sp. NPDC091662]|uniref:AAA family ATPase n=1 Tax=Microbacterium sp. NPDC091662 TaxID=3364211 RepID=UPI0037FB3AEE